MSKLTVAFDINGTLTFPELRQFFKLIDRSQCHLIAWSTLGATYAKTFCQKHGLEADEYLRKHKVQVDIAIDDFPDSIKNARLVLGFRLN
ncbi:MAG: hypothetical protein PVJ09_01925 [Candidatus Woesebacteria bacterium]|jgi:hypothetical protein